MTKDFIPTKELMRKNNLTMIIVKDRLERGWTFEDAISTPPQKKNRYDKPLSVLAKENGIAYYTLLYRIAKMGMSAEEALNHGPSMIKKYDFDTKQAAEDIGISQRTLYRQLRNGLTLDEIREKYKHRKVEEWQN